MKKKIVILIVALIFSTTGNPKAQINFKKKYQYYKRICSKRSSYELNKQACVEFEEYKRTSNSAVGKMEKTLTDSKMNADKLSKLIVQNDAIMAKKREQIRANLKTVRSNRKQIEQLDRDVTNSLISMQYVSDENQIIDIVMSSTNLEDLMTRVTGYATINNENMQNIKSLEEKSKELDDAQNYLKEDLAKLRKTREKQKELLIEFQRKEVDLYPKPNSGGNGIYNDKIDALDLAKIEDKSKNWGKPIAHGSVTASTWAYPAGSWHPGIDVGTGQVGKDITAPANGILLATSTAGGYGNHITAVFKKGDYVYSMIFAHLSGFVDVTQFKKGQTIAKSGNTGNSTGPHVHVEVLQHNTSSISTVVNNFKKQKDYWFGLGYSSKGDCKSVCRLEPAKVFKSPMGTRY